jgi:YegS/Rv2252/BmrU family lipid kinase
MKVGVIVNPVAGGGRLQRRRKLIDASLDRHFGRVELVETKAAGEACVLARDMALSGADLVIAAGGDGTASEAADGLLQASREAGRLAEFGLIPCGNGADFARGLGLPEDFEAAIGRIAAAAPRRIDAGLASYIDGRGALASRYFLNVASLGLSGATDRAVNADRRKGRGSARALFLWHTVVEFLRYRFQEVLISVDDGDALEARVALVAAANGRFFGGGMMIAPDAEPDDGAFDIVIVRAAGKMKLILDIRLLYGGRHRGHQSVSILRGRKVTVEPAGGRLANAALLDLDGDSPGRIPATFEMLPGALSMRW